MLCRGGIDNTTYAGVAEPWVWCSILAAHSTKAIVTRPTYAMPTCHTYTVYADYTEYAVKVCMVRPSL